MTDVWIALMTGSRKWKDYKLVDAICSGIYAAHPEVIFRHGDNEEGLDAMVRAWCEEHGVPQDACPAKWDVPCGTQCDHRKIGRSGRVFYSCAGGARNTWMVQKQANECHAFTTSGCIGTLDCMGKAKKAGIPTKEHKAAA